MLFNSITFLAFFIIVFIIYWFLFQKSVPSQNAFLLLTGYVFYAWWDWRFLLLLIGLSGANYLIALMISSSGSEKPRSFWLIAGLIINLGALITFKYMNFFITGFIDMIRLFGYELSVSTTQIILPLGISFYTFLSISYLIDVKKRTVMAETNPINTLLVLSFFPIIFAGPIQRPASLLPQIKRSRSFNYSDSADALKQILWGLFAKVVIADSISGTVDNIFRDYATLPGSTLLLGGILYAVQIYADFSGYSNMAIGISKLLGFEIMQNFNYPYFSKDITEFWKKWHISLTTWLRNYVFLPLSFSVSWKLRSEKVLYIKADLFVYIVASLITWFITGLWHGANYTFVIWGLMHGVFLIIYHIQRKPRQRLFKRWNIKADNGWLRTFETILTLLIVLAGWILFRSSDTIQAFDFLGGIISSSIFTMPALHTRLIIALILTILFFIIEWNGRNEKYAIQKFASGRSTFLRWTFYYIISGLIFYFSGNEQAFIYTQF